MYADMRPGEIRFGACGSLISGGSAFSHGLLFSHPVPLSIGYFFYGFVDVSSHRV